MKRKCVHYCAVEALRLRKKRVKTLSLCQRQHYVNVATRRKNHALAILQLVLYASFMLNSGVNSCQQKVYIDDACGQWSADIEYVTKVQSLDGAAVVSDDARSVCIANEMCMLKYRCTNGCAAMHPTPNVCAKCPCTQPKSCFSSSDS